MSELEGKKLDELRKLARERGLLKGMAVYQYTKAEIAEGLTNGAMPTRDGINLTDIIAEALSGKIKTQGINKEAVLEIVQEEISKNIQSDDKIQGLISQEIAKASIPRTILVENRNTSGISVDVGLQHKDFDKLLKLANLRLDVMLVGASGSGKTTVCKCIAKALSLPFYFVPVGNQTTKTDLLGYMDANGKYVSSLLRRWYEEGGVLLLDEIDAGNANVLTVLNALLDNGSGSFPDGMIERHKDAIFFCAANTYGRGANRMFVGRNQLDASTLERFVVVDFDYDEDLEMSISTNKPFTTKIQALRKAVRELGEKVVISPRASTKGGVLLSQGFAESEVLDMVVWKGVLPEIKEKIKQKARI